MKNLPLSNGACGLQVHVRLWTRIAVPTRAPDVHDSETVSSPAALRGFAGPFACRTGNVLPGVGGQNCRSPQRGDAVHVSGTLGRSSEAKGPVLQRPVLVKVSRQPYKKVRATSSG